MTQTEAIVELESEGMTHSDAQAVADAAQIKENAVEQEKVTPKERRAEELLEIAASGPTLVSPDGLMRIVFTEDEKYKFEFDGKARPPKTREQARKALMVYKAATLRDMDTEQNARDNLDRKAEEGREKRNMTATATKNESKTSKNGTTTKKAEPKLPKGFEMVKGADLHVGDLVLNAGGKGAPEGNEVIERIDSGEVFPEDSRGGQYARLDLVPQRFKAGSKNAQENTRSKWASVRKNFKVKRAENGDPLPKRQPKANGK